MGCHNLSKPRCGSARSFGVSAKASPRLCFRCLLMFHTSICSSKCHRELNEQLLDSRDKMFGCAIDGSAYEFVTRCHWTEKSFSSTNHRTRVLLLLSLFERKKKISSAFFNRSETSQGIRCIRTRIRTTGQQRHWKVDYPVSDLWLVDRVSCDRMDFLDEMISVVVGLGCWTDSCSTSDQSLRQFGLSPSIFRCRAKRSDASVSNRLCSGNVHPMLDRL